MEIYNCHLKIAHFIKLFDLSIQQAQFQTQTKIERRNLRFKRYFIKFYFNTYFIAIIIVFVRVFHFKVCLLLLKVIRGKGKRWKQVSGERLPRRDSSGFSVKEMEPRFIALNIFFMILCIIYKLYFLHNNTSIFLPFSNSMHCTTCFINIRYIKIWLQYEIEPIITGNQNQIDTLFKVKTSLELMIYNLYSNSVIVYTRDCPLFELISVFCENAFLWRFNFLFRSTEASEDKMFGME